MPVSPLHRLRPPLASAGMLCKRTYGAWLQPAVPTRALLHAARRTGPPRTQLWSELHEALCAQRADESQTNQVVRALTRHSVVGGLVLEPYEDTQQEATMRWRHTSTENCLQPVILPIIPYDNTHVLAWTRPRPYRPCEQDDEPKTSRQEADCRLQKRTFQGWQFLL